jgi:hypothetical protein
MDRFFGPGNPGALFKRPANVYNFHDTVMASVVFRAEQVTKPGAHSSSVNNEDFEDDSPVDKLAIRIHQEAQEHSLREEATKLQYLALKKKKKEASNFLAPPPASLLEARPFSLITKPLGDHHKNNKPTTASNGKAKAHNNLHDAVIDVDVDEGKENICPSSTKKHRTTVAGTDLFSMFTSAMSKAVADAAFW